MSIWTEHSIARLKELWQGGASCTECAIRLSDEFGPVTRNAVIGKVNRLGFRRSDAAMLQKEVARVTAAAESRRKNRESARRSKAAARERRLAEAPAGGPVRAVPAPVVTVCTPRFEAAPAPSVVPVGAVEQLFSNGAPAAVLRLTAFSCRWPIGEPRDPDFRFCGAPRGDASSYCDEHRRLGTAPAAPREKLSVSRPAA